MKFRILSTILTCVHFSLVQGLDPHVSEQNVTVDNSRRVIAGRIGNPAELQFLVRIEPGDKLCGGSVISNYFILTAAHCIVDTECDRIRIFPSNWLPGTTSRIQPVQCIVHEKFDRSINFYYDMALIQSLTDMLEDDDFKAILLPAPGTRYPANTRAVVAGWGKTEDRTYPDRLFSGDVELVDWESCDYRNTLCIPSGECGVSVKPKRALCTQGLADSLNTASCHGDSGGPVVVDNTIAAVIVGTRLTEENECLIGTQSLHLSVSEFLPWIYSIIDPDRDTSNYPVIAEPF